MAASHAASPRRVSLAHQFLIASFVILLTGMTVIAWWVGREIETGVVNRTAAVTALYVDSFISPHLQDLAHSSTLADEQLARLDALLSTTPLGQRIVSFKVWDYDGRILYSTFPQLIGRRFAGNRGLARALNGEVASHISDLGGEENVAERQRWDRLVETYAPVRLAGNQRVLAVGEFYQRVDDLQAEISAAQWRSLLVVSGATLAMYLLLAGIVGHGSNLIARQQVELSEKVAQVTEVLAQNTQLNERVRRAASRTTALNERLLRRISADLHDGPAQDMGLALLRLGAMAAYCEQSSVTGSDGRPIGDDFKTVRTALQNAMEEVRAISAGLRLPELEGLSTSAIAARAVQDHEMKFQHKVALSTEGDALSAALPVKITMYHVLQEALNNGFRHAGAAGQRVRLWHTAGRVWLEVSDAGQGFNPEQVTGERLGLAGMRERVALLGGSFEVSSEPGRGTNVQASLPLQPSNEDEND